MERKYCSDGGEQTTKRNNQLQTKGQKRTKMTSKKMFPSDAEQAVA